MAAGIKIEISGKFCTGKTVLRKMIAEMISDKTILEYIVVDGNHKTSESIKSMQDKYDVVIIENDPVSEDTENIKEKL